MAILVTGCCGLIGSAMVEHFAACGHRVTGIDNNMRRDFFGADGDTSFVRNWLLSRVPHFEVYDVDIRDGGAVLDLFEQRAFTAVIHCAAQPSHDRAGRIPLIDFAVNATGTLNLLEANRQCSPGTPFVFMSTNKVYGDRPNELELVELPTRWDFADPALANGIPETLSVDASMHSIFGASKLAADIMVQEYGRYFDMPTVCLRAGCLTGRNHAGVELHGFLSYLVKCNLTQSCYRVYGYGGKQVRDNLHAHDVARFVELFLRAPRRAAVYNLGGGKANAISILEAFDLVARVSGKPMEWVYEETHRSGDHICYYSDLARTTRDYPEWQVTWDLDAITVDLVEGWQRRLADERAKA